MNRLVIRGGEAWIEDADCPDRLCVKQGRISRNGQAVTCLPHKLVITVESGKETELDVAEGARGALVEGIPVHSLRSDGFVANQEVVFGSLGQTLSVKHVSWDTQSYMPGVLLGIRESSHLSGLVIGLESLMSL